MMVFSIALNLGVLAAYVIHFGVSYNYDVYYLMFLFPVLTCVVGFIAVQLMIMTSGKMRKQRVPEQEDLVEEV